MLTLMLSWRHFVAAGIFVTLIAPALACRCVEPAMSVGYDRGYAIVLGKVAQVDDLAPIGAGSGSKAVVHVDRAWKHDLPAEITVTSRTTCAFPWKPGGRYVLVILREADGSLSTRECLGNAEADKAVPRIQWLEQHATQAAVMA